MPVTFILFYLKNASLQCNYLSAAANDCEPVLCWVCSFSLQLYRMYTIPIPRPTVYIPV